MNQLEYLIHLNAVVGQHYFSPETMQFFNSRVCKTGFKVIGSKIYFVTSECPPNQDRRYSIRVGDLESGKVETYADSFLKYKTLAAAKLVLSKIGGNSNEHKAMA